MVMVVVLECGGGDGRGDGGGFSILDLPLSAYRVRLSAKGGENSTLATE